MKTDQLKNLSSGIEIQNVRNHSIFLVEEVNNVTKKATVLNIDTKEEKEVAFATIRRNYDLVDGSIIKDVEVNKEEVKEKAPVKTSDQVNEEIPTKTIRKPEAKEAPVKRTRTSQSTSEIHNMLTLLEEGIQKHFPTSKRHVTGQYIAYRRKQNFIEIYEGKRSLYIMIRTKRLTDKQKDELTHVYPKKHGWSQDGKLIIRNEEDLQKAFEFIEISYIDSEGWSDGNIGKEDSNKKEDSNS